jgi:hypothetical protein
VVGNKVMGNTGDALEDSGDLGIDGESLVCYSFTDLTHGRRPTSNEICYGVADVHVEGYDTARHISWRRMGFDFDDVYVAALCEFPYNFLCRRQS